MRTRQLAVLVLAALGFVAPGWSRSVEPSVCQYVEIVDRCKKELLILKTGGSTIERRVRLGEGSPGLSNPTGVRFSTVPGEGELYSFVAQGPYLEVIDFRELYPLEVVPVGGLFGMPDLVLYRLDASGPVSIGLETRYLLYAIGFRGDTPWLVIFDQEALLAKPLYWNLAILAAGPLCAGDECPGSGLDIAVGGPPASGGIQEAFVSVIDVTAAEALRIYRIVIHEDFSWEVSLDSWNDEGVSFSGIAQRANGLDFDSTGTVPFGVFQTTSVVKNLSDGQSACAVTGKPTDVAVWGPGVSMEHPNYLFVASPDTEDSGFLLGYPAGQCPDGNPASAAIPVGGAPYALALSSDTSASPWIYTANGFDWISAIHVELVSNPVTGDRIDLLGSFEIQVDGGCPYEVAIRDESYEECVNFLTVPPNGSKPPSVDCLTYPDDPRCVDVHVHFQEP